MQVIAKVNGLDNLLKNLSQVKEAPGLLADSLNTTALHVQNRLKQETASVKAVDTGGLRDSWHIQKATKSKLEARVGSHLAANSSFTGKNESDNKFPYAEAIEYGTRPHFPPPRALMPWVKRKLKVKDEREQKAVAYLIARQISKNGTKGRLIFETATNDTQAVLDREVGKAATKIESNWGN